MGGIRMRMQQGLSALCMQHGCRLVKHFIPGLCLATRLSCHSAGLHGPLQP